MPKYVGTTTENFGIGSCNIRVERGEELDLSRIDNQVAVRSRTDEDKATVKGRATAEKENIVQVLLEGGHVAEAK